MREEKRECVEGVEGLWSEGQEQAKPVCANRALTSALEGYRVYVRAHGLTGGAPSTLQNSRNHMHGYPPFEWRIPLV